MEPIKPPKTIKLYQLVRQTGMSFTTTGGSSSASASLGIGFYPSLQEAEQNRTMEVLKDTSSGGINKPRWHVFELEFPNPAYEE
jgi:hypothetical protein